MQKVLDAPSCLVAARKVYDTTALVTQLAEAATPQPRPRTCSHSATPHLMLGGWSDAGGQHHAQGGTSWFWAMSDLTGLAW